jgi:hypothetical protein
MTTHLSPLDALLDQLAKAVQVAPVTVVPLICDDPFSPEMLGMHVGTDYTARYEDTTVIAHIPDQHYSHYPHIEILIQGDVSMRLDVFIQILPSVLAILSDPRFQAARAE